MLSMRTTLELPDDLFRETKARAALRGQSLKSFVTEALTSYLAESTEAAPHPPWHALVGSVSPTVLREIDDRIESELGQVDPGHWE